MRTMSISAPPAWSLFSLLVASACIPVLAKRCDFRQLLARGARKGFGFSRTMVKVLSKLTQSFPAKGTIVHSSKGVLSETSSRSPGTYRVSTFQIYTPGRLIEKHTSASPGKSDAPFAGSPPQGSLLRSGHEPFLDRLNLLPM